MTVLTDPNSYRFGEVFATEINKLQENYLHAFTTLAILEPIYVRGLSSIRGIIRYDTTLPSHPMIFPVVSLLPVVSTEACDTYAVVSRHSHEKSLTSHLLIVRPGSSAPASRVVARAPR